MTALQILKKVRAEMRPNAKIGEYELPVILKAMHEFAALRQPLVSGRSEQCAHESSKISDDATCWVCSDCGARY